MSGYEYPQSGTILDYEIIESLVAGLKTLAILDTALGSRENVFNERIDAIPPVDLDDDGVPQNDGFIVVRTMLPVGGRRRSDSGLRKLVFQTSLESYPHVENVNRWHEDVNNRLEAYILRTWAPSPTRSRIAVPARTLTDPAPPRWDNEKRRFYSVVDFAITLAPQTP